MRTYTGLVHMLHGVSVLLIAGLIWCVPPAAATFRFADTIATASDLGTLPNGSIDRSGDLESSRREFDRDYYKFTITTPGTVTVYSEKSSSNWRFDSMGFLYSGASTSLLITKDDDSGTGNNFLIKARLNTPGDYYTMLRGYNMNSEVGGYTLYIRFEPDGTMYYRDSDSDGYGNPDDTVVQGAPPATGRWVIIGGDCNDADATIHPGAVDNQCDGIDNDCDGEVDEDADDSLKVLYYEDMDGDGYGNADITKRSCPLTSAGWVTTPGDCNDSNAAINPGAVDICGDGIDQDCSGMDRVCGSNSVCVDIADVPLTTQIKMAPPLVMFLLDDSGSMDFDLLCDTESGLFRYSSSGESAYIQYGDSNIGLNSYSKDVRKYWVTQWSGYNKLYYNPEVTYKPWPTYANANVNATRKHPVFNYGTRDMDSTSFWSFAGVTLRYAHYYVKSGSNVFMVNLSGGSARYYIVTDKGSSSHYALESLTEVTAASVPADVRVASYVAALQNMANWYQYSRNRELAAKSAVAQVISGVSGVRIGLQSINNGNLCGVKSINVDGIDLTSTVLQKLYAVPSRGGTYLRSALYKIGSYYDKSSGAGDGGIGASPYETEANGGTCQQAFTIVMTDGYYNNDSGYNVGNADTASSTSVWDGPPYGDAYSNTLADIAMHFYERDLRPDLDDLLPTSDLDPNNAQHMVTYTLAFGVTGTLTPSDYDCPTSNCPGAPGKVAWPDPRSSSKAKIDDLFHAAVNGRGTFLSAGNSETLVTALLSLMEDIQNRVMTGASVTMNSQELKRDSQLYQSFFDSSNWSGDIKAFSLARAASGKVTTTKVWSVQDVFKTKGTNWWDFGRRILTGNASGATPFRYANLTAAQQQILPKNVLEFVRGDSSREEANGGPFRDRDSLILGDVVNASPIYENGVVYVGANDGMLHAFDAATGGELFAYIPSVVVENLAYLADPEYTHNYYVDNTVYTRTLKSGSTSTTWLIGGLGKGGRGVYGIDITNPKAIAEGRIPSTWEYPAFGTTDPDMGFSYSVASIAKANTGENVILLGNGYDSVDGKAVLYLLKMDGTLLRKIDTQAGSPVASAGQCNGLSTPVPVDLNFDGTMDVVYAGDLLGNMWKFDLSGSTKESWGVAYSGHPLFTARNKAGNIQSIVSRPSVMTQCDKTRKGTLVLFGTGRYLGYSDTSNTETQSVYGIWDWADEWDNPESRYLGSFGTPTGTPPTRALSNFSGVTLLQQRVTSGTNTYVETSANAIDWFDPSAWTSEGSSYAGGTHVGWYMDLPDSGERVIARTQLIDGIAVVVSIVPKNSPCAAGGGSIVYMLNGCSGGRPNSEFFDKDGDGDVDSDDGIYSGKRYNDDIYYAPGILNDPDGDTDALILNKDEQILIKKELLGLFYWRFVE